MTWPQPHIERVEVNGITLRVASLGNGPAVVLCHGFPQLGYTWRHVMPQLAAAGYTTIAPDLRGYGGSSVPKSIGDYRQQLICSDLIGLAEMYGHERAVFVGHDMGGMAVWNIAACHRDHVRAVCAIGTPHAMPGRAPLTELWQRSPGVFDYQLYLQDAGPAEQELEADIERSLTLLIRAPGEGVCALDRYSDVRHRGGLLADMPTNPLRSRLLSPADLNYYADAFRLTGFGGALNWYRNYRPNWEWLVDNARYPIEGSALLVSTDRDPVLTEDMSLGLERAIPRLVRAHLRDCGHYVPEEQPECLAAILINWLNGLPT